MLASSMYNIDKRTKAIEKELSMMDLLGMDRTYITKLRVSNDLGPEFQWLDGATLQCSLFRGSYHWCRLVAGSVHENKILIPLNTDLWVEKIDAEEVYIQQAVNKFSLRKSYIVGTKSNRNRVGRLYSKDYIILTPHIDVDEYFIESTGNVHKILYDWKRFSDKTIHIDKNIVPVDPDVSFPYEIKSSRVVKKLLSYKIEPDNLSIRVSINSILLFQNGKLCLSDAGKIFEIDNEIQNVYSIQAREMTKYLKKEYSISLYVEEGQ